MDFLWWLIMKYVGLLITDCTGFVTFFIETLASILAILFYKGFSFQNLRKCHFQQKTKFLKLMNSKKFQLNIYCQNS